MLQNNTDYKYVPHIISASQLQRQAGAIVGLVHKQNKGPYFISKQNELQAVIIDIKEYEMLKNAQSENELKSAEIAIQDYNGEKKYKKLKPLDCSLLDLYDQD